MTVMLGLCEPSVPSSATATKALFGRMGGNNPKLLGTFLTWGNVPSASDYVNAASIGASVVACWQPMTTPGGVRTAIDYPGFLTGVHDAYMASVCAIWAAAPCPIYVRFMHEANLNGQYPWDTAGLTTANYLAYYRYVVNYIRAHAPNVKIVWCVNADPPDDQAHARPFTQLYPGDAYTDFTGFDWYNYASLKSAGWHNWSGDVPDYGPLALTYAPLAAIGKPIIICETNSHYTGGDKSQWLMSGFLKTIPTLMPLVVGVCLFNFDNSGSGEIDWRFDAPAAPNTQAAWIRVANDPIFGGTLPRNRPQRQRVTAGPAGVLLAGA